jgi:hypothetical protein
MQSVTSNAVYKELHKIVARTQLQIEPTQGSEFAGENVYDVEYEGGLHHVSGLFVLKSTVDFSKRIFTLTKAPSQVSGGNYMWTLIGLSTGQQILSRITYDGGVHLWGSVTISSDLSAAIDFWYKDNSVTQ